MNVAELDFVKTDVLERLLSFRDSLRDDISFLEETSFHRHLLKLLDDHLSDTIREIGG